MWLPKSGSSAGGGHSFTGADSTTQQRRLSMVAVAIDKDKNSQHALKWAIENLLTRGQTVILIHVISKSSSGVAGGDAVAAKQQNEKQTRDLFLTFHCFCTRKDIQCLDVILEETNVPKALTDYIAYAAIEYLVLGASAKHGFIRFKSSDTSTYVMKGAPDFCTVYVISKGKISTAKKALRPAPFVSPLHEQIAQEQNTNNNNNDNVNSNSNPNSNPSCDIVRNKPSFNVRGTEKTTPRAMPDDPEVIRSPFQRGRGLNVKLLCGELSETDTDISFVSSGRPSSDRLSAMYFDSASMDSGITSRMSTSSDRSFGSSIIGPRPSDFGSVQDFSSCSIDSKLSAGSQDDNESEMRRLKMELLKTMDLYSTACKEALTAKQKTVELQRWRVEEEQRLEEARLAEEAAREAAEKERAMYRAALEKAEASQRIAEIESQKRVSAEMKALKDSDDEPGMVPQGQLRYRRYTIEEIEEATEYFSEAKKIGEGGYGPVFKGRLDHTPVAIKVLRPDAAQGRSQFQQEVEVLSCMRHPNMVLLLGACPEYGCLVYEYMANGSLDDRLFRRGNTPPLSWQLRFKIAAEIATGILFLHQTKPEPIVHRDLKPGNILLDRNFVSKVSDVGLARLLPPSVAEDITQYRMTSTAGTFCYIDPEYQQTGMLGVKSDVYSLGIMLLQMITAKPAMGLTHHVRRSIERDTFKDILDPTVTDWPYEETLGFAKLALQCAELRRKDRPDLGKQILPELSRLRDLGEESMPPMLVYTGPSPNQSQTSFTKEVSSSSGEKPSETGQ